MPRVGLQPTTPVFERKKTVHALDHAAGHCDRPGVTGLSKIVALMSILRIM
jgi:hypothetical protein